MKKHSILFLALLCPAFSFSQTGTIQGKVIDAESGKILPFANVLIRAENTGTYTDVDGHYLLSKLDAGEYFVEVTFLGYNSQTRMAEVKPNDTTAVDFGLVSLSAELGEVVITAPKDEILREPMPMTQIEPIQIERLNATNTAEVLSEVPGVSVARSGNWGSKPLFQGLTDDRVLVFIDNVRITQACPMGSDACTATIEPDMINSMEVQVGPGSSQFGSGNMGGVININTIGSQYMHQDKLKIDAEIAGRYKSVSNSRSGMFSLKGGNKKFDFAASAGAGWHDNYKIRPQGSDYTFFPSEIIPYSYFNSYWGHLKTTYRPAPDHEISLTSQMYRGENIGWPARLKGGYSIITIEKRDLLALNYSFAHKGKYFRKLEFIAGYQPMHHNLLNSLFDETIRFFGRSWTDNYQASVKSFFSFHNKHLVTAGADGFLWKMFTDRQEISQGKETGFVPIVNDGFINETGIFVTDQFRYNQKLIIDAGLRLNFVQSGAKPIENDSILLGNLTNQYLIWTGNISPLYRLNENITIAGAIVKGFNASTPVNRFLNAAMMDGFFHYGNPQLKPEENISKRIGFRGMFHTKWRFGIEYFHNNIKNLIQRKVNTELVSPIPGLKGVRQSYNIPDAVITGANSFISYYVTPKLQLTLSAAYLYGKDNDNTPLPFIAPFEFTPKITYEDKRKGLWITFRSDIAAAQDRYAPQYAEVHTPAYTVFDLTGGWKISDAVELSGGINNLSNQYYRRHINLAQLPEPGLNLFINAKITIPVVGGKAAKVRMKDAQLLTLQVEGMSCQTFCTKTVKERSEATQGVIQSVIHFNEKKAEVIIEKDADVNKIIEAIERAGYKVTVISVKPYQQPEKK